MSLFSSEPLFALSFMVRLVPMFQGTGPRSIQVKDPILTLLKLPLLLTPSSSPPLPPPPNSWSPVSYPLHLQLISWMTTFTSINSLLFFIGQPSAWAQWENLKMQLASGRAIFDGAGFRHCEPCDYETQVIVRIIALPFQKPFLHILDSNRLV